MGTGELKRTQALAAGLRCFMFSVLANLLFARDDSRNDRLDDCNLRQFL